MNRSITWRSCLTALVAAQILTSAAWSQDFRGGYPGAEQVPGAGHSGPDLINGGNQLVPVPQPVLPPQEALPWELHKAREQIAKLQEDVEQLRRLREENAKLREDLEKLREQVEVLRWNINALGLNPVNPDNPGPHASSGRLVLNNLTGVTQPVLVDGVGYYVVPGRMVLLRNRGPIRVHAPSESPKQYLPENWRLTERGWELEVRIAYPPPGNQLWRPSNSGLVSISR